MKAKISAIIPCYNVKKELLFQCINSILKQDFQDFEIILVNDGSDSPYVDIIREVARLDERIIIFNQGKEGVSAARNNGLKQATGDYITFIDSDDIIVPYYFSEAYQIIETNQADYVVGCVYQTESRHPVIYRSPNPEVIIKDSIEYKPSLISSMIKFADGSYIGRGPVARLVRRSLLNDICFQENVKIGEDIIWNLDVISKCSRVYLVHQIWYLYWENKRSVTRKYNPNIVSICEIHLQELIQRIDINNEKEMAAYCHHIHELLNDYVFGCYYGRAECGLAVYRRYISFCKLCQRKPWSLFQTFFSNTKCDWKTKAECLLIKFKLLYWAYYIQNFVCKIRK